MEVRIARDTKLMLRESGDHSRSLSSPFAVVILLFVFGSAVAALVPLLLAITAVFATNALIALPSQFIPVDEQIAEVILLVGLAVGVDYSLFYLRREREERAAGRGERAALEAAAATSGRAVLVSGITVLIAMAGMFLSGDKSFMSFSIGTMMVVAVAMLGSLTVLPALLGRLGDKVEKGRIPFLGRLRSKNGESRFWSAILDRVLRRPVVSAVAAGAVLVALAIPAFSLNTATTGVDDISIPEIEPLCPDCAKTRVETAGKTLWCARHSEHHVRAHVVGYSSATDTASHSWDSATGT